MANTVTDLIPKILARGVLALREMAIMTRLVNRDVADVPQKKGSTVDVPIPAAQTATDVTPAEVHPAPADTTINTVPIALTRWKKSNFHLTDKDELEIEADENFLPMQTSSALRALANEVDAYLLGLYTKFYGYHGTAGTTPFGVPGVKDATGIRKVLNKQVAPPDNRHCVVDPEAEAAALALREFSDRNFSGSIAAMLEGDLNRKLGFQWWMDHLVPTHTAGTASDGATTVAVDNGAGYAIGTKTLNVDVAAGTKTLVVGDIVSFAGHSQTYVVTTAATLDTTGVNMVIEPGLAAAVVDDEEITVRASHVVNLAFQRDAIAFASRPLKQEGPEMMAVADPVSGIALRLERVRQYKQTVWEFDILYGADVVRRELGARLAG